MFYSINNKTKCSCHKTINDCPSPKVLIDKADFFEDERQY